MSIAQVKVDSLSGRRGREDLKGSHLSLAALTPDAIYTLNLICTSHRMDISHHSQGGWQHPLPKMAEKLGGGGTVSGFPDTWS